MAKKAVNQPNFDQMSAEELRQFIASKESAGPSYPASSASVGVTQASGTLSPSVGNVAVVGAGVGSVAPIVASGVNASANGYSLPSDLDSLWSQAAKPEAQKAEDIATAIKFSIVGNRSKALNVYHSKNEQGVHGLRVALAIIQSLGLKAEPVTKSTMTKWENGKATEVVCDPYRFLKLSASGNKSTAPRLLFAIAQQLGAHGVDWS